MSTSPTAVDASGNGASRPSTTTSTPAPSTANVTTPANNTQTQGTTQLQATTQPRGTTQLQATPQLQGTTQLQATTQPQGTTQLQTTTQPQTIAQSQAPAQSQTTAQSQATTQPQTTAQSQATTDAQSKDSTQGKDGAPSKDGTQSKDGAPSKDGTQSKDGAPSKDGTQSKDGSQTRNGQTGRSKGDQRSKNDKLAQSSSGGSLANNKSDREGHPVDPVTGANQDEFLDYEQPGTLPFCWGRNYTSAASDRDGPMGRGFRHTYEHTLSIGLGQVLYTDPEGHEIELPLPGSERSKTYRHGYVLQVRHQGAVTTYTIARTGDPTLEFVHDPQRGEEPRLAHLRVQGAFMDFLYDAAGQLSGLLETEGGFAIETKLILDGGGHILEVRRGPRYAPELSLVAAYTYDDAGCLVSWQDALGATAVYAYDAEGRIVRMTDRNGFSFHFTYDEDGRCIETAGDGGLYRVAFRYEPENRRTFITRSDGGVWIHEYDEKGTLRSVLDPCGGRRERLVDDEGKVVADLRRDGRTLTLLYDASGHHHGVVDDFDQLHPPLDQMPHPAEPPMHSIPVTAGEQQWGRLPRALARMDDVMRWLPAAVQSTVLALRGEGADAKGTIQHGRDALGRVVEEIDAAGRSRAWERDPAGNPVRYIDRDGREHSTVITSWNLVGTTVNPMGHRTDFDYTPRADVARVVDPGGSECRYEYDLKDRLVRVLRHGVVREEYVYDPAGHLIEKRDGAGNVLLRRTMDENGQLAERELASGQAHRLAHDRRGRVTLASTDQAEVRRAFDARGNRTLDERDGRGVRHRFTDGELRTTTYFERFTVSYERASGGALTIEAPVGGVHRIVSNGRESVFLELGNGTSAFSSYDGDGRCRGRVIWRTRSQKTELWAVRYTYSAEGELRRVEDNVRGSTVYIYDMAHRLIDEVGSSDAPASITLDPAGNVLEKTGLPRAELIEGNRLARAGDERFRYDARNHLAEHVASSGETTHYRYDSFDMLVEVAWSGREARWTAGYDALRRRLFKALGDQRTDYYWDGDRLAAERGPTGALRLYVYASPEALVPLLFIDYDGLDAAPESGRIYYVFGNQLGVPMHIEDQAGNVVWFARHVEPYGALTVHPGATVACALRFPGHYADEETGLHYNHYRYYSPRLGRYLQSDPAGQAGGVNLYAYAPNPVVDVDVLGLMPCGGNSAAELSTEQEGAANPIRTLDAQAPNLAQTVPDRAVTRLEDGSVAIGTHFRIEGDGAFQQAVSDRLDKVLDTDSGKALMLALQKSSKVLTLSHEKHDKSSSGPVNGPESDDPHGGLIRATPEGSVVRDGNGTPVLGEDGEPLRGTGEGADAFVKLNPDQTIANPLAPGEPLPNDAALFNEMSRALDINRGEWSSTDSAGKSPVGETKEGAPALTTSAGLALAKYLAERGYPHDGRAGTTGAQNPSRVYSLGLDKAVVDNARNLAGKAGHSPVSSGQLGTLGANNKLTIVGHGSPDRFGGMTPAELAAHLQQNGVKALGTLSLKGCDSAEFALSLMEELQKQNIAVERITGRNNKVTITSSGRTLVFKDGEWVHQAPGAKSEVRLDAQNKAVATDPYLTRDTAAVEARSKGLRAKINAGSLPAETTTSSAVAPQPSPLLLALKGKDIPRAMELAQALLSSTEDGSGELAPGALAELAHGFFVGPMPEPGPTAPPGYDTLFAQVENLSHQLVESGLGDERTPQTLSPVEEELLKHAEQSDRTPAAIKARAMGALSSATPVQSGEAEGDQPFMSTKEAFVDEFINGTPETRLQDAGITSRVANAARSGPVRISDKGVRPVKAGKLPLQNYTLQKVIGHGVSGNVALAEHESQGQTKNVVIKKIKLEAGKEDEQIDNILRESAIQMYLMDQSTEPVVVELQKAIVAKDSIYIVLEPAEGSLESHLQKNPVSRTQLLGVFHDLAGSYAEMHKAGILHKDIKADNVLVKDGKYLISDFGLSKRIDGVHQHIKEDARRFGLMILENTQALTGGQLSARDQRTLDSLKSDFGIFTPSKIAAHTMPRDPGTVDRLVDIVRQLYSEDPESPMQADFMKQIQAELWDLRTRSLMDELSDAAPTHSWFTSTQGRALTPSQKRVYSLGSDKAVVDNARNLGGKDGHSPVSADQLSTLGANDKLTIVGHGSSDRFGGMTPAELATHLQQNEVKALETLSLKGCESATFALSLMEELQKQGIAVERITGRSDQVTITSSGNTLVLKEEAWVHQAPGTKTEVRLDQEGRVVTRDVYTGRSDTAVEASSRDLRGLVNADPLPGTDGLYTNLAEMINGLDEMRAYIPEAPGLGHQSSTVNLVRRIVDQFKFEGTITIVYDDGGTQAILEDRQVIAKKLKDGEPLTPFEKSSQGDKTNEEKLALLVPGFEPANGGSEQTVKLGTGTLVFVPQSKFKDPPNTPFGFTAGYDRTDNLAAYLNTDNALKLQPLGWGQPSGYYKLDKNAQEAINNIQEEINNTQEELAANDAKIGENTQALKAKGLEPTQKRELNGQKTALTATKTALNATKRALNAKLGKLKNQDAESSFVKMPSLSSKAHTWAAATPEEFAKVLSTLGPRGAMATHVMGEIDKGTPVIPLYGMGHAERAQNCPASHELFNLVAGVARAQNQSPKQFPKGVALLVTASLTESHYEDLDSLIRDPAGKGGAVLKNATGGERWNDSTIAAFERAVEELDLKNRVNRVTIENTEKSVNDAADKLSHMGEGEILLLQIGGFPPAVFDKLFSHTNMMGVLEGPNTANMMMGHGKPYVKGGDAQKAQLKAPESKQGFQDEQALINTVSEVLNGNLTSWLPSDESSTLQPKDGDIASYLLELSKEDSSLRDYHKSLKEEYASQNTDAFAEAMKEVSGPLRESMIARLGSVYSLGEDKAVVDNARNLAVKGGHRAVSTGELGSLGENAKLTIVGHGSAEHFGGMTPEDLAVHLKQNGVKALGTLSLKGCESATFALDLMKALQQQGIAVKRITGRNDKVTIASSGQTLVLKDSEWVRHAPGTKIEVRLDEGTVVTRDVYAGRSKEEVEASTEGLRDLMTADPLPEPNTDSHATEPEHITVLKQQETLRIFVPRAPGTGHQGCSVQLMMKLTQLGFSGRFDVIYDDTQKPDENTGSNPDKLVSLLPGFKADGPAIQSLETLGLNVHVMSLSTFQNSDPKEAKYGLTGAMDNEKKPEDILTKLGVDSFVQLQPMDWNRESGKRGVTYRDELGEEQFEEVEELSGLGYIYDVTPPLDPEGMVQEELAKSDAQNKTAGVLAFLEQTKTKNAHTMVAYGLGTGMEPGAAVFELFNLTMGILYAQDDRAAGTDLQEKGVIIGAAGWTDPKQIEMLQKIFSGEWEGGLRLLVDSEDRTSQEGWEDLVERLKSRLLKKEDGSPRVTVLNVEDPNAVETIANVAPSQVLVVEFSPGRLPMSVFEHMRLQTTLPNSFESVNGMDKERQNKPYIHVGKDISNRFPGKDTLSDFAKADVMANRNKLIGQQLQGREGLAGWLLNYGSYKQVEAIEAVAKMKLDVTGLRGEQGKVSTYAGKVRVVNVVKNGSSKLVSNTLAEYTRRSDINAFYEKNQEAITNKLREKDPDRLIGRLINDTQKPDSDLSKYFQALKERATDKDQVSLAFEKLVELDKAHQASVSAEPSTSGTTLAQSSDSVVYSLDPGEASGTPDKVVEDNVRNLVSKGGRRRVSAAQLGELGANDKLTIVGHGSSDRFGSMTPEDLAAHLQKNGVKKLGTLSLKGCDSAEFALSLMEELQKQNIAVERITGRSDQVTITSSGQTLVLKDGVWVHQAPGAKSEVRLDVQNKAVATDPYLTRDTAAVEARSKDLRKKINAGSLPAESTNSPGAATSTDPQEHVGGVTGSESQDQAAKQAAAASLIQNAWRLSTKAQKNVNEERREDGASVTQKRREELLGLDPHYLTQLYGLRVIQAWNPPSAQLDITVENKLSTSYLRDAYDDPKFPGVLGLFNRAIGQLLTEQGVDRGNHLYFLVNSKQVAQRVSSRAGGASPPTSSIVAGQAGLYVLDSGLSPSDENADLLRQYLKEIGATPSTYQVFKLLNDTGTGPARGDGVNNAAQLEALLNSDDFERLKRRADPRGGHAFRNVFMASVKMIEGLNTKAILDSDDFQRGILVEHSLGSIHENVAMLATFSDNTARAARYYDLLVDELFLTLAVARPYTEEDLLQAEREIQDRRNPAVRQLVSGGDVERALHPAWSGMDALVSALEAAIQVSGTAVQTMDREPTQGQGNYFEVTAVLAAQGRLADAATVHEAGVLFATLHPSTPLYQPTTPEEVVAAVQERLNLFQQGKLPNEVRMLSLVLDTTIQVDARTQEDDAAPSHVDQVVEALAEPVRQGKLQILQARSYQKYQGLGSTKVMAGMVTLLRSSAQETRQSTESAEHLRQLDTSGNVARDEWQFFTHLLKHASDEELGMIAASTGNAAFVASEQLFPRGGGTPYVEGLPFLMKNANIESWLTNAELLKLDSFGLVTSTFLGISGLGTRVTIGQESTGRLIEKLFAVGHMMPDYRPNENPTLPSFRQLFYHLSTILKEASGRDDPSESLDFNLRDPDKIPFRQPDPHAEELKLSALTDAYREVAKRQDAEERRVAEGTRGATSPRASTPLDHVLASYLTLGFMLLPKDNKDGYVKPLITRFGGSEALTLIQLSTAMFDGRSPGGGLLDRLTPEGRAQLSSYWLEALLGLDVAGIRKTDVLGQFLEGYGLTRDSDIPESSELAQQIASFGKYAPMHVTERLLTVAKDTNLARAIKRFIRRDYEIYQQGSGEDGTEAAESRSADGDSSGGEGDRPGSLEPRGGAPEAAGSTETGTGASQDGTNAVTTTAEALVHTMVAKSATWSSPRTPTDKREAIALAGQLLQLLGVDTVILDKPGGQSTDPEAPESEHSTCVCAK